MGKGVKGLESSEGRGGKAMRMLARDERGREGPPRREGTKGKRVEAGLGSVRVNA